MFLRVYCRTKRDLIDDAGEMLNILNMALQEVDLEINLAMRSWLQYDNTNKYLGHGVSQGCDHQTKGLKRLSGLFWAAFGNLRRGVLVNILMSLKKVFNQCLICFHMQ